MLCWYVHCQFRGYWGGEGGGGKMGKGRGESCEGLYRQEVLTQKCGLNYFLGKAVPEKKVSSSSGTLEVSLAAESMQTTP